MEFIKSSFSSETKDEKFFDDIEASVIAQLPAEKALAVLRKNQIAARMKKLGSTYIPGVGQYAGSIDARTYHRWNNEFPGCWENEEFVNAFLFDNPEYKNPGYKPKPNPFHNPTLLTKQGV